MKSYFKFLILLIFISSCQSRETSISFYHWKSTYNPEESDLNTLEKLNTQNIYLRFFDVDWSENSIIPKADLSFKHSKITIDQAIIPTIFITNRSIKNSKGDQIEDMAEKIGNRIIQKAKKYNLAFKEVQLDCDWSASTQYKYFDLLKKIRTYLPKGTRLSCTLRLHQLKYPDKTGVPPVDACALMYYNMGKIDGTNTDNSILDNDIAKPYLDNLDEYPLPLDFALPIFNWLVISRGGKIVHLLNEVTPDALNNGKFKKIDDNHYEVIESLYFESQYLYKADKLRLEIVTYDKLEKAAQMLSEHVNQKKTNIIFYHLNHTNLNNHSYENLKELASIFR